MPLVSPPTPHTKSDCQHNTPSACFSFDYKVRAKGGKAMGQGLGCDRKNGASLRRASKAAHRKSSGAFG